MIEDGLIERDTRVPHFDRDRFSVVIDDIALTSMCGAVAGQQRHDPRNERRDRTSDQWLGAGLKQLHGRMIGLQYGAIGDQQLWVGSVFEQTTKALFAGGEPSLIGLCFLRTLPRLLVASTIDQYPAPSNSPP